MDSEININYQRVAQAIDYIRQNFKAQPDLDEVARYLNLSPAHFQRIFTTWAGTSPKKFLQYISVEYAKSILKEQQATLFDAAFETGLSSTSRLHDLFISIEGMTPAEYRNGGRNLAINYSFASSPFGRLIVASTEKGVCYMAFEENEEKAFTDLKNRFLNADFHLESDEIQKMPLLFLRIIQIRCLKSSCI
jgi:AraC family transcriptional regulator of adaptative response/methylated-DNA-[protein]-cysteine methyltransferase